MERRLLTDLKKRIKRKRLQHFVVQVETTQQGGISFLANFNIFATNQSERAKRKNVDTHAADWLKLKFTLVT